MGMIMHKKALHSHQRKNMQVGSQLAYFGRLWERLHSSTSATSKQSVPVVFETQIGELEVANDSDSNEVLEGVEKIEPEDEGLPQQLEFRNHIWVLDFVARTEPWNGNAALAKAMDQ